MEDPTLDARIAQPCWLTDPPDVIRLERDAEAAGATPFSLWRIPGHKTLVHDGVRLHLCHEAASAHIRASIAPMVEEGVPFAFLISPGADLRASWDAMSRFMAVLAPSPSRSPLQSQASTRAALLHMRALQALDGLLAGASHRKIGVALFGQAAISHRWHADGELRAQVRHLIRRGRTLMTGGYRQLLDPQRSARR